MFASPGKVKGGKRVNEDEERLGEGVPRVAAACAGSAGSLGLAPLFEKALRVNRRRPGLAVVVA